VPKFAENACLGVCNHANVLEIAGLSATSCPAKQPRAFKRGLFRAGRHRVSPAFAAALPESEIRSITPENFSETMKNPAC